MKWSAPALILLGFFAFEEAHSSEWDSYYFRSHSSIPSLSFLWAQEYSGIDLARELMEKNDPDKKLKARVATLENLNSANFDPAFLHPQFNEWVRSRQTPPIGHGDLAVSTSLGSWAAASSRAELVLASSDGQSASIASLKALEQRVLLSQKGLFPKLDVLQFSIDLPKGGNHLVALPGEGILLVQSSGNDYPFFQNSRHEVSSSTLFISNLSPLGITAASSSQNPDSWIGAFSSDALLNVKIKDQFLPFGGTSGATPLVAGVIADIRAVLPGITLDEIKILLKNSGIKVPAEPSSAQYSLNAFRTLWHAWKLQKHWSEKRKIETAESLFLEDSKRFYLLAQKEKSAEKALSLLRAAFFLNPMDLVSRKEIAAIYRQKGLVTNAMYYEKLGELNFDEVKQLISNPTFVQFVPELLRYSLRFAERDQLEKWMVQLLRPESSVNEADKMHLLKGTGRVPYLKTEKMIAVALGLQDADFDEAAKITSEEDWFQVCEKLRNQEQERPTNDAVSELEQFKFRLVSTAHGLLKTPGNDRYYEEVAKIWKAIILKSTEPLRVRKKACSELSE